MKIDSSSSASSPPRATPSSRRGAPSAPQPAQAGRADANADAIEISPEGRQVIDFPTDARQRAELVARLRQEVDAGTYRLDPEVIARRLTERADS